MCALDTIRFARQHPLFPGGIAPQPFLADSLHFIGRTLPHGLAEGAMAARLSARTGRIPAHYNYIVIILGTA
jgi:hypothetical protein